MIERTLSSSQKVAGGNRNHEKIIWGPMHRRMMYGGKIYWNKNNELPLDADVSSMTISWLTVEEVLGLVSCPPRGSGSRTVMPSPWPLVVQHSLCSWLHLELHAWEGVGKCTRATQKGLWLYYLRLGEEQTFFQTSQLLSWSFTGLCWHSRYSIWSFPQVFFKWNFAPLNWILAPSVHASKFCLIIWFLLLMPLSLPHLHPLTILTSTAHMPAKIF